MADVLDAPVFRVVFSLIPSHLFLPPVCPFLYIGSLSSLCQLLLYNTIFARYSWQAFLLLNLAMSAARVSLFLSGIT